MKFEKRANTMKNRVVWMLMLVFLLTGCGLVSGKPETVEDEIETDEIVYVYEDADVLERVSIEKSVFEEECLKIYIIGIEEPTFLNCYDKDFEIIENDWEYQYRAGKLIIRGEDAEDISGVVFGDYNMEYYIRYLDSEEPAMFSLSFADDLGWEPCEESEKPYYTEEELNQQQEEINQKEQQLADTFAEFEGLWVSQDNPDVYIRFYYEEGKRCMEMQKMGADGEYYNEYYSVDEISVDEGYDYEILSIIDSPSWGMLLRYELSEDHNFLSRDFENSTIYVRQ
ncbi:MAG: hypothetical protein ACI4DU_05290 [Lachnospiraceae bacterium]